MEKKGHAARARGKSIKLADRLRAVQNNQGLHHYVYDGTGTRVLKGSYIKQQTSVDGQTTTTYNMSPYTVYVNPYMVCTYYADDVDITKHYYMGAQRVASKLYQHGYSLSTTVDEPIEPEEGSNKTDPDPPYTFFTQVGIMNNVVIEEALTIAGDLDLTLNGTDGTLPGAPGNSLGEMAYAPCDDIDWQSFDPNGEYEGGNLQYIDCLCRFDPQQAQSLGINCNAYTQVYWYHPDYLGNTEFVTDAGGYPYQFFYYSAFGETLVQQDANTGNFATPYKFNAKELDMETGNYYYGARYYNPQTSIWFGVDPLAANYSHVTPYNFVEGNPIMLIDPTGLGPDSTGVHDGCGVQFVDQDGNTIAKYETEKMNVDIVIPKSIGEVPVVNINEVLLKYTEMDDIDIIGVGVDWDFTFGMGGGRSVETAVLLDGEDFGQQVTYDVTRQNAGFNGSFGFYVFVADFQNDNDKNLNASSYEGRSFALVGNLPNGIGVSKTWATPDPTVNFGWQSYFDISKRNWSGFTIGPGFGGGGQWSRQNTTLRH